MVELPKVALSKFLKVALFSAGRIIPPHKVVFYSRKDDLRLRQIKGRTNGPVKKVVL